MAAHLSANPYKYGLCPKCGAAELRAAAEVRVRVSVRVSVRISEP